MDSRSNPRAFRTRHQCPAEPASVALDVTLPERGTVLSFGRSVQEDGQRPMAIMLDLKRVGSGFAWLGVALCLLLGVMGGAKVWVKGN